MVRARQQVGLGGALAMGVAMAIGGLATPVLIGGCGGGTPEVHRLAATELPVEQRKAFYLEYRRRVLTAGGSAEQIMALGDLCKQYNLNGTPEGLKITEEGDAKQWAGTGANDQSIMNSQYMRNMKAMDEASGSGGEHHHKSGE